MNTMACTTVPTPISSLGTTPTPTLGTTPAPTPATNNTNTTHDHSLLQQTHSTHNMTNTSRGPGDVGSDHCPRDTNLANVQHLQALRQLRDDNGCLHSPRDDVCRPSVQMTTINSSDRSSGRCDLITADIRSNSLLPNRTESVNCQLKHNRRSLYSHKQFSRSYKLSTIYSYTKSSNDNSNLSLINLSNSIINLNVISSSILTTQNTIQHNLEHSCARLRCTKACTCTSVPVFTTSSSGEPLAVDAKCEDGNSTMNTKVKHKTVGNNFECSSAVNKQKLLAIYGGKLWSHLLYFVLLMAILPDISECCSSRSTPRPRPSSPTLRPNITFQTYTCPPAYAAWYCLNGATCFTVKIGESILYNCECADGHMGQRCEFKDLDGSYLPSREKVLLETASIAGGATVVVILVFSVVFAVFLLLRNTRDKYNRELEGVARISININSTTALWDHDTTYSHHTFVTTPTHASAPHTTTHTTHTTHVPTTIIIPPPSQHAKYVHVDSKQAYLSPDTPVAAPHTLPPDCVYDVSSAAAAGLYPHQPCGASTAGAAGAGAAVFACTGPNEPFYQPPARVVRTVTTITDMASIYMHPRQEVHQVEVRQQVNVMKVDPKEFKYSKHSPSCDAEVASTTAVFDDPSWQLRSAVVGNGGVTWQQYKASSWLFSSHQQQQQHQEAMQHQQQQQQQKQQQVVAVPWKIIEHKQFAQPTLTQENIRKDNSVLINKLPLSSCTNKVPPVTDTILTNTRTVSSDVGGEDERLGDISSDVKANDDIIALMIHDDVDSYAFSSSNGGSNVVGSSKGGCCVVDRSSVDNVDYNGVSGRSVDGVQGNVNKGFDDSSEADGQAQACDGGHAAGNII